MSTQSGSKMTSVQCVVQCVMPLDELRPAENGDCDTRPVFSVGVYRAYVAVNGAPGGGPGHGLVWLG